ncbi:MAG: amidohydrolase family protein [Lachnospiraceae bacterium]
MVAVKSGWLICSPREIREKSGFIMEDGVIQRILTNQEIDRMILDLELSAEQCLDYSDDILLPGLVNAHMHQYGLLSHGIPQAGLVTDFETFLSNYWWPMIEDRIRKEEVLITTRASMAEMLHSGITAFCDILEAPFTEDGTLIEQGELIEQTGMRGIVSLESSQRISNENGWQCLSQNEKAAAYFKQKGGLVQGAICTHTTFTCTKDFIREAALLAAEQDCAFQFHLSESKYEPEWLQRKQGESPTALYEKVNALSDRTIATQCVKLSQEEIEALSRNHVQTVHMPISNCEVGGGIAPIPQMLGSGLHTGLGTDGYINDFFAVMREAFLIHKAAQESTEVMSAQEVFSMATEYGAQSMGLCNCGKLQEEWKADFTVYKNRFLTPVNRENIIEQIVVHGRSTCVTDVFINGVQIMKEQHLLTLDEEGCRQEMLQCAEKFWKEIR